MTARAAPDSIVNVASVPLRSPFRYPGGKTWLVPTVRRWLEGVARRRGAAPALLVEPFAGGAIVGLTAAFERLADRVLLVERDARVAAVWRAILGDGAERLARRILAFDPTHESVRAELADPAPAPDSGDEAFRTVLRNRVCRGGIMAPGAGLIKSGENGRGLRSRWYPETLARRIRDIAAIRDRIEFVEGDGVEVLRAHAGDPRAAFFVDPPYTAGGPTGKRAGARLYAHHELDHEALFAAAAGVAGDVLLSYDDAPDVRALAERHGFATRVVAMKNTHHAKMKELLASRDPGGLG